MKTIDYFFYSIFFSLLSFTSGFADQTLTKPDLTLANIYNENINVKNYWVSEKYDGVRTFWTGKQLISRQGNIFNAPEWFMVDFPKTQLDGELWLDRSSFANLSGIVRTQKPIHEDWKQVKYIVFDLPVHKGNFTKRHEAYKELVKNLNIPWLLAAPQWRVKNHSELMQQLKIITDNGAEGLMLHRANSYYHVNRNNDLIKLKLHQDAEASVISYSPGKGQFKGMMGSLLVETDDGKKFKVGTGFTYEERLNPPAIGSTITYQYDGFTKTGLPRFARFLHVRELN